MKQLYIIIVGILFTNIAIGQIIYFPDPDFKAKLLLPNTPQVLTSKDLAGNPVTIDANGNGEVEVSEAQNIGELMILNAFAINDITGITAFSNLKKLNIASSGLTSADLSAMNNLEVVQLSHASMTSFILPPPNGLLFALFVQGNQLTSLDVSQYPELTNLYCSNNLLTNLDISNLTNLEYFECDGNQIAALDVNAPTLKWLRCYGNQLQTLDASNLPELTFLECHDNLLTTLNISNSPLFKLNCSNNLLTTLNLPTTLNEVICNNNQLTELNLDGINGLTKLNCSFNLLSTLSIPASLIDLERLNCSNNLLSSLDVLITNPNGGFFWELNCSNNILTSLDLSHLPGQVNYFDCSNNDLLSLFVNFVYSNTMNFNGNPQLQFVCCPESLNSAIQYRLNEYGYTNVVVNSYCNFTPFGTFYTLNGQSHIDTNQNGCNLTDVAYPFMRYNITNGPITGSIIANQTGSYEINIQSGVHTVTPVLENPSYFNVSPGSVQISFPTQPSPVSQFFCIVPNGIHPDLEVIYFATENAIPGFDTTYKLVCRNKGNTIISGNVTLNFEDAVMDFVQSAILPSTQSSGTLHWDFSNLQPFQSFNTSLVFNLNAPTEIPPVNDGDTLSFYSAVTSGGTDETPQDNAFTFNQLVINSLDPNDKTCLEGTTITPEMVGEFVHYMIRFENTGTANAQNIVVKDMIDISKFDISTMIPLHSSHSFITRITEINKVEFIFENINLPFDDANNDGYIAFKIKTKPSLVLGDTFSNTASIYFDYNFPVVTDPAVTTVAILKTKDFEFSDYFAVYPNPVNDILHIQSKQNTQINSISIYNTLGQLLIVIPNAKNVSTMDVSQIPTGNYFISIRSDNGTSNTKFIKN